MLRLEKTSDAVTRPTYSRARAVWQEKVVLQVVKAPSASMERKPSGCSEEPVLHNRPGTAKEINWEKSGERTKTEEGNISRPIKIPYHNP